MLLILLIKLQKWENLTNETNIGRRIFETFAKDHLNKTLYLYKLMTLETNLFNRKGLSSFSYIY